MAGNVSTLMRNEATLDLARRTPAAEAVRLTDIGDHRESMLRLMQLITRKGPDGIDPADDALNDNVMLLALRRWTTLRCGVMEARDEAGYVAFHFDRRLIAATG